MERLLGVDDLDRLGRGEEDDGDGLGDEQRAQLGHLVQVLPGGAQPLAHGGGGLLDVRADVEEQRGADREGGGVEVQRGLAAGGGDKDAGERGPERDGAGEGHVQCGVGLALGDLNLLGARLGRNR